MYTIISMSKNNDGYNYKDKIVKKVSSYFNELLKAIRNNDIKKLNYLSKYIHEAKYTSLGYATTGPGKGFGGDKFKHLVDSLKNSNAFKTGFINDILDVELYVENIGVDMISDLITNLIQDVLSEYTLNKVNSLKMGHVIRNVKTNYWNESIQKWELEDLPTIEYVSSANGKIFNYILVPFEYTTDDSQKERILSKIFTDCIYNIYENKILSNPQDYESYIRELKDDRKIVYKNKVAKLINEEFGQGSAKEEGTRYATSKGLLDLVQKYPKIKQFIENNIKNK